MLKRLLSLILALAMCLSVALVIPVFAADEIFSVNFEKDGVNYAVGFNGSRAAYKGEAADRRDCKRHGCTQPAALHRIP